MNIGIIEDNDFFANKLRDEINATEEHSVLLVSESVETFHNLYSINLKLDLILLDLILPGVSGLDAIYSIKKENPDITIVVLTIKNDTTSIFRALRAGANGYLLKTASLNIKEELDIIKKGGSPVTPSIARKIFEHFNPPKTFFLKGKKQKLTKKEITVLRHLIDGLSHKLIAEKMGISVNGVYFHVKNIYKKLQVHSKTEVLKKYMDGLIEL